MKYNVSIFFLLIILVILSCNSNRLKTDEKKLVNQIMTEKEQLSQEESDRVQREKQLADSLAKLPKGFRFKEERGVDLNDPPFVIDIAGDFDKIKEFKFSEYIADFKWIILEMPEDKNLYPSSNCTPIISKNSIVISGSQYLLNYTRSGKLIEEICSNKTRDFSSYKGPLGKAHIFNDKLYYRFADNVEKKSYLMEYDLQTKDNSISFPSTIENYQISGKGKMIADLSVKKKDRFDDYIPVHKNLWVGIKNKWESACEGTMLVTLSNTNDTIAIFKDYDQIKNFSHTIFRGDFPSISYLYRNILTFSNSFNDTIFRLIPPNRLVPAFIVSLGDRGMNAREGFTPGIDISNKLYVYDWKETPKRIYLILREGYGSGTMKIFHAVYDKRTQEFYRLSSESIPLAEKKDKQENLLMEVKRDIPGVFSYWPEDISNEGEICYIISVKKLRDIIHSKQFNLLNLPKESTEKQIGRAHV